MVCRLSRIAPDILTSTDDRGPPPRRYGDRYDDHRRGGYRDEPYYRRDDRDRGYYGGRRDRDRDDGYPPRGGDRYGGRDDRYSSRGGGGGYHDRYERGDRDGGRPRDFPPAAAYGDPAPRESRDPYGGRGYEDWRSRRDY